MPGCWRIPGLVPGAFTAADGLLVPAATDVPRADRRVDIELLVDTQVPEHTVVVLGCDPALALLGAHLTRRYPTLRLVWVPRSSRPPCACSGVGKRMRRGRIWGSRERRVQYALCAA